MRTSTFLRAGVGLALGAAGAAAGQAASGTIVLRATATFSDGSSADRLYEVKSDADSDGDGLNDSGWLRVACDGAVVSAVYYNVKSPRDSASGMASGKRMHKPFTITKELGPSTPMFRQSGGGKVVGWDLATGKGARMAGKPTYDIKENKGARVDHGRASDDSAGKTMAHDSWTAVNLKEGSPNLCA